MIPRRSYTVLLMLALLPQPGKANADSPGETTKMDIHSDPFRVMVTLGESTTAGGWSRERERCWASRLASLICDMQTDPVELINVGIGANLISTRSPTYKNSGKPAASERLDKHVMAHHPDLLIISYGLNDARGGTPLDLFAEEMEGIIDRVGQELDPPPLIGAARPLFHDRLYSRRREVGPRFIENIPRIQCAHQARGGGKELFVRRFARSV